IVQCACLQFAKACEECQIGAEVMTGRQLAEAGGTVDKEPFGVGKPHKRRLRDIANLGRVSFQLVELLQFLTSRTARATCCQPFFIRYSAGVTPLGLPLDLSETSSRSQRR